MLELLTGAMKNSQHHIKDVGDNFTEERAIKFIKSNAMIHA